MSKASEAALADLHSQLAQVLKDALGNLDEDGKPNTAILNVARQFLKDNFITADAGNQKTPLGELAGLPVFDEDSNVTPLRAHGG